MESSLKILEKNTTIMVIGAGAAGLSAALELADRGYTVHLFEKNTIGSGASGKNPGRMGHGFHYVDIETAKMYLRASIQVQRKYPDYLIGKELNWEHPYRHGRYFITKNSDVSKEQILATYEEIKNEYRRLIIEDPNNEVFGSADNFFRILHPSEYENQVNTSIVDIGIETAEHLFCWQSFSADITQKILSCPNIILHEQTEIMQLSRGDEGMPRFILRTNTGEIFTTNFIINSTWQNIEFINDQIGLRMVPKSRTNRLKTLLVVQLPESLKYSNSMFFCMGQHCMMSNMGDGRAMLTFARVTNMEVSDKLNISNKAQRLINNGATDIEKLTIAKQMLNGIAAYIPEIINATILDVKFGIVQTEGKLTLDDLNNPNSSVHRRCYYGIREEQIGLVSNPCMKLFYFVENGRMVADIIDEQIHATSVIYSCMQAIQQKINDLGFYLARDTKKTILNNLERHESSYLMDNDIEKIITPIIQTIQFKNSLNQPITFFKSTKCSSSSSREEGVMLKNRS